MRTTPRAPSGAKPRVGTKGPQEPITCVAYSAALIGGIIEFAKRQDSDIKAAPEEWADGIRRWLLHREWQYRS